MLKKINCHKNDILTYLDVVIIVNCILCSFSIISLVALLCVVAQHTAVAVCRSSTHSSATHSEAWNDPWDYWSVHFKIWLLLGAGASSSPPFRHREHTSNKHSLWDHFFFQTDRKDNKQNEENHLCLSGAGNIASIIFPAQKSLATYVCVCVCSCVWLGVWLVYHNIACELVWKYDSARILLQPPSRCWSPLVSFLTKYHFYDSKMKKKK